MDTKQTPTYLIRTDDTSYTETIVETYNIPETDWMRLPFTIYDETSAVYVRVAEEPESENLVAEVTYVEDLPVRVLLASDLASATEYANEQQWSPEVWTWVQVPVDEVVQYSLLSADVG